MTSTWPEVPLGEIADFIRGVTFKPTQVGPLGAEGSIACLRTSNVQALLHLDDVWAIPESLCRRDEQRLRRGDILISSANSWNLVGKCSWVDDLPWPSTFGGFVTALRTRSSRLDARFLYRWFSSPPVQTTLRSFGQKTTNISNLSLDRCRLLPVPVPPIEEQRRIAAVLDQADGLRTKRRAAFPLLGELTESIFLELFGDPVPNLMGWEKVPLAEVLMKIDSGKSPVCLTRPAASDEWGVLKLGAVTWGEYDADEQKALPEGVAPDERVEVRQGDVLFVRKNTAELVGGCALVHNTRPRLLLSDLIFRLVPRSPAPVLPVFLHRLLSMPNKRREVRKLAGGSAGSMPNISKSRLLDFEIELPPLALQQEFANRDAAVRALFLQARSASLVAESAFSSLQHRAFKEPL